MHISEPCIRYISNHNSSGRVTEFNSKFCSSNYVEGGGGCAKDIQFRLFYNFVINIVIIYMLERNQKVKH